MNTASILPNLDCATDDDLSGYATNYSGPHADLVREYARSLRLARDCRRVGEIARALRLEASCDRIYQRLPRFDRW